MLALQPVRELKTTLLLGSPLSMVESVRNVESEFDKSVTYVGISILAITSANTYTRSLYDL